MISQQTFVCSHWTRLCSAIDGNTPWRYSPHTHTSVQYALIQSAAKLKVEIVQTVIWWMRILIFIQILSKTDIRLRDDRAGSFQFQIWHGLHSYHIWNIPHGCFCWATECPCGVWCHGSTSCLLYDGPPILKHDFKSKFVRKIDLHCGDIFEILIYRFMSIFLS